MNHGAPMIRAVLFDWAGTTVDYGSRAPVEAFVETFRRNGIELMTAEARGPMGRAKRDHISAIFALPRVAEAWSLLNHRSPDDADIDRLYSDFLPMQRGILAKHSEVIPGVPEVIAECRRRGLKIGSSTGYARSLMEILRPIARAGGFDPDVVICADDVQEGRPAPWMIFHATERLGVFPMEAVVVVDDTPVGITAGLNAGAWTVAVTKTGNALGLSEQEVAQLDEAELGCKLEAAAASFQQHGAHYVVESVADLLPVLDDLACRTSRKSSS
jgi:phosphonoacetaldehyde hydrolase